MGWTDAHVEVRGKQASSSEALSLTASRQGLSLTRSQWASVFSCLHSPALRHTEPCWLFIPGPQALRANTHTQWALSLVARGLIWMKYFKYQLYGGGSQFRQAISTQHTRPPWNVRCQNDCFPLQCFLALGYESICCAWFWTQLCSLQSSTSSHPGPTGGWDQLEKAMFYMAPAIHT